MGFSLFASCVIFACVCLTIKADICLNIRGRKEQTPFIKGTGIHFPREPLSKIDAERYVRYLVY